MDPISMILGLGTGVGSAIGNFFTGQENKRHETAMKAAQVRGAPWTGRSPTQEISPQKDAFSTIASGVLGGGQAGAELGKWGATGGWDSLLGKKKNMESSAAESGANMASNVGSSISSAFGGEAPASAGNSMQAPTFWSSLARGNRYA